MPLFNKRLVNNPISKNAALLAIFALCCTGFVAVVNSLTADTIAEQQKMYLDSVLEQLVPHKMEDDNLSQRCILVTSPELGSKAPLSAYLLERDNVLEAIAIEAVAPDGYNGEIKLILAVDEHNTLLGVRTLSHQETPGLGDKIELRKSSWVLNFAGKAFSADDKSWKVKKDGGQFDQFTGATITPRAYVKAIAKALSFVEQHRQSLIKSHNPCGGEL
ncbi:electron transport complex, RnfABCDGE type, G subunit [Shewanella denitrificans OS217]|jgi:Na+-translocating ferredoxin:NAD+ oxidoreductase subunit G|uniref:Ion-translocating oxidoreductase complex subunit G n=1 Tax=Shewanella denitrificans (strain OS217 / ATCC BAA-1090 / DSM 15013) TaxID=318161 RepID=Q12N26_SHEDO|nr:electron transport complex subunit RsxG [Shewanella denitrificans]ABE55150.1 electron transport complex, RnfABCDGE type, G subunit [Shewanella denitrificans OS217]